VEEGGGFFDRGGYLGLSAEYGLDGLTRQRRSFASGFGTKRTSSNVRSTVANGGKADVARKAYFGNF
jgi:hypothetical protein